VTNLDQDLAAQGSISIYYPALQYTDRCVDDFGTTALIKKGLHFPPLTISLFIIYEPM
jgi:hypothetical protein